MWTCRVALCPRPRVLQNTPSGSFDKVGWWLGVQGGGCRNCRRGQVYPPERRGLVSPLSFIPHGGVRPSHHESTCLSQSTLGPCMVQIWSRNTRYFEPPEPANSTVWLPKNGSVYSSKFVPGPILYEKTFNLIFSGNKVHYAYF